jgi:very-short-patch-repair endonuclease
MKKSRITTRDIIITGQHLSPELYAEAKELRQNMTPAKAILWQRLRAAAWEATISAVSR